MPYTIETFKSEQPAVFTFWGTANTLKTKDGKKNRTFFAYYISDNQLPFPEEKWTLGQYTFAKGKTKYLPKGQEISFVIDELGNKYFEISDLI